MLSSTADHLFWMARSMERAENTARMLDVTYRMSLLKHSMDAFNEWLTERELAKTNVIEINKMIN